MALQTTLSFVSIDKNANVLIVKDSTGAYPANLLKAILEVGRLDGKNTKTVEQSQTDFNPLLPTLLGIQSGENIVIDSVLLGFTGVGKKPEAFADGVMEVQYFAVLDSPKQVVAQACAAFVSGIGTADLPDVDQVLIGNTRYTINKNLQTDAGTVLYLVDCIEESATTLYPVHIASLKVLITAKAEYNILTSIGNLSFCGCGSGDEKVIAVTSMKTIKEAAESSYLTSDFKRADRLICAAAEFEPITLCSC